MALYPYQIVVRDGSIVASHPSNIFIRDSSISFQLILTICSGETPIAGAPHSQVVNLVTSSTSMTKESSVDIETKSTTPIHKIRHKNSRCLQLHNAEKRKLKRRTDGGFIITTRRLREEKTKDKNERRTTRFIVDEINITHETSLNERTMRIYANIGANDVPMTGRGKNPMLHELLELALSSTILSYFSCQILE